jgi:hypothetical protein
MRIAALTTDTPHHTYWAWRLAEAGLLGGVVLERKQLAAPFPTHHPFEDERDDYERETLLRDCPAAIDQMAPTLAADTVNEPDVARWLDRLAPDLLVSFGTGLIAQPLVAAWRGRLLNLHGGDPEEYRGLDTHLWAVYHGDFDGIVTTLHAVDEALDTGAIVERAPVPLPDELHQLRAANTAVCVELTLRAAGDRSTAIPQRGRGRYYSFMPAVLKDVCLRRWSRRTVVA